MLVAQSGESQTVFLHVFRRKRYAVLDPIYDPSTLPTAFHGKYEEIEPLYKRSLATDDENFWGLDHPEAATGLNNWVWFLGKGYSAARPTTFDHPQTPFSPNHSGKI